MSHKAITINSQTPDLNSNVEVGLSDLTTNSSVGSLQYDTTWKSNAVSVGGLNYAVAGTPTYLNKVANQTATFDFNSGNSASFGHSAQFSSAGYSAYVWGSPTISSGDVFDGVGLENNVSRDTVAYDLLGNSTSFYCGFRFQHGKAHIISVQMSIFEGPTQPSQFIARFFNVTQNAYFGPRILTDNRGSLITAVLDLRQATEPEIVQIRQESGSGVWDVRFFHDTDESSTWGWNSSSNSYLNAHSEQFYSFT
jgi:hypothetical protein